jgi:hypothetical protein
MKWRVCQHALRIASRLFRVTMISEQVQVCRSCHTSDAYQTRPPILTGACSSASFWGSELAFRVLVRQLQPQPIPQPPISPVCALLAYHDSLDCFVIHKRSSTHSRAIARKPLARTTGTATARLWFCGLVPEKVICDLLQLLDASTQRAWGEDNPSAYGYRDSLPHVVESS